MTHTLTLHGHVPSKKNNYRRSKQGGLMIDKATEGYILALEQQARIFWGRKATLEYVSIDATFYVRDGRADLDNKYVTLSDVLVKAGVIANDSIARIKSFCAMSVKDPNERVVVTLTEAA